MNKLDYNNWVTKGLLIAFTMAIAAFLMTLHHDGKMRSDVRNLQQQLAQASATVVHDTIRDSIPVDTQPVVVVDRTDYKKQMADKQLIRDLGLKVSQIEAENHSLRETLGKVQMQAEKRDSDSLYTYHDRWVDFELNLYSREMWYQMRDSFDTFIDRQYKHKILWGLIRWGTKSYEVKFVNYNPNSHVKYNRSVKVVK